MNDSELLERSLDGMLDERESAALDARLATDGELVRHLMQLSRDEALWREVVGAAPVVKETNFRGLITMAASLLAVASIFWLVVQTGPAINPASQDTETKRIERWCEDLGSDELEKRDTATRELTQRGKSILPTLEKLLQSPDAEVRVRAASIRDAIRKNLRAKALRVDLVPRKNHVKPGEAAHVDTMLRNVEDFPVTIYAPGGVVSGRAYDLSVTKDGKRVEVQAPYQTAESWRDVVIDEKDFRVLQPGETIKVHHQGFDCRWEKFPTMTGDPGVSFPLDHGTYEVKGGFASKRPDDSKTQGPQNRRFPGQQKERSKAELSEKAKLLLEESWEGTLEGTATLVVE